MLTGNMLFEHELKARIREEIERLKDNLTSRTTIVDYPTYCYHAGQISGLERVVEDYCMDVNSKINKRD